MIIALLNLLVVLKALLRDPELRALMLVFLLLVASGTVFYASVEGWSTLDAVYFSVVALATVGFGDFSPQTNAGKIFTIFYLLFGIGIFATLVGKVAVIVIQGNPRLRSGAIKDE
jgi:voltage-gated potassium channel